MWPALMLLCLSSLPLPGGQVASSEPLSDSAWSALVQRNASVDAAPGAQASEMTPVPPSLVTVRSRTSPAGLNLTHVPAGTANRTNASVPAAPGSTAGGVASSAPSATSSQRAPSTTAAGLPPPSTPHAQVPSTQASVPTARTAAAHTGSAPSTLGPTGPTSAHSAASPATPTGPQAQVPTTMPVVTHQPVLTTAGRTPPHPSDATSDPTAPRPSVAPVTSAVVPTTQAQARETAASTVPARHTSPAPTAETASPTTQPHPTPPNSGPGGPGASQTPGHGETRATPGTGPTPLSSGDQRMPATDSCQPTTQVPYLVVTPKPLAPSLVNRTFLLVVLVLGVALFVTVVVVFTLQAYESYKKKDYTQVDYLINGMYADSEM
ncbi:uncharacterized protein C11orf24 homolog isoform X2 [Dipodomys merriami]|uniref:uncharacterized protein C11orf24 homolog isoform X2 n=1 Tax=Dipodomys merriami TaxID=94247 RepID=UPI003855EE83